MVIGGRPVMDPGDEEFRPIKTKSAKGGNARGNGDRGSGGDRGRKDDR